MELYEIIEQLKVTREAKTLASEKLAKLKEEFESTNRDLILDVEELTAEVAELESQARQERLELYDGVDKGKMYGVSVKEYTTLVYDEDKALEYSKERLPDAVITRLDKKVFETVAGTGRLEFVEIRKEPRALIAKEL